VTYAITPGGVLRAAEALQSDRESFDRNEVAYLLQLAYTSGSTDREVADVAELHATWERHGVRPLTPEERYAARMDEMAKAAAAAAEAAERPYNEHPGGPVDWHTGEPVDEATAILSAATDDVDSDGDGDGD